MTTWQEFLGATSPEEFQFEDGSTPKMWIEEGFTNPQDARAWMEVGGFDPERVKELEAAGITPDQVKRRVTEQEELDMNLSYSRRSIAYMFCNNDLDMDQLKQLIQ